METFRLNHIAVLVRSVESAARVLAQRGLKCNPPERFEGEGTLEIYVGEVETQSALLLLMEPTREEGSYGRALKKRGPGLHHIAIDIAHLLDLPGWTLHKRLTDRLAYYKRPGFPALIEMQARDDRKGPPFITDAQIACAPAIIESLRTPGLSASDETWFEIAGRKISLREICA